MKLSTLRFLNLLGSLALLIVSIIVYVSLLSPAYEEVNNLRGELAAKSELLLEQKAIVDKVIDLLDEYQTLSGPKQTITLVLPNREEYPSLVNQVTALGRAAGLSVESIGLTSLSSQQSTLEERHNLPVIGTVQLLLELKGPYQSLKNFLQSVETNIRVMDVVSFAVNPGNASGENYSYNMVVNAYYQSL